MELGKIEFTGYLPDDWTLTPPIETETGFIIQCAVRPFQWGMSKHRCRKTARWIAAVDSCLYAMQFAESDWINDVAREDASICGDARRIWDAALMIRSVVLLARFYEDLIYGS